MAWFGVFDGAAALLCLAIAVVFLGALSAASLTLQGTRISPPAAAPARVLTCLESVLCCVAAFCSFFFFVVQCRS